MLQPRSIVKAVILSFITCGLYGIYWFIQLTDEAHQAAGRQTTASGFMAFLYTLVTCGIYFIYWCYKMGKTIIEAQEKRGMRPDNDAPAIYTVLAVFGLAIVSEAIMQNALNDIAEFDRRQAEEAAASEQAPVSATPSLLLKKQQD